MIDYGKPWDDPELRPLLLNTWRNGPYEVFDIPLWAPPIIECPNGTPMQYVDGHPFADYVGVSGLGASSAMLTRPSPLAGLWAYRECTSLTDVTDGTSNTALAIETGSNNGCWLAGGPSTVRGYVSHKPAIGPDSQFGGMHAGASMTVFADGHLRFLSDSTNSEVISSIMTIAGGEAPLPDE
ncbi:MAG: hypothetical protein KDA93_13850 [Planctomycetaceae bacterium]|nr:hypothetical protein [Planctomycetaceae bacterium]